MVKQNITLITLQYWWSWKTWSCWSNCSIKKYFYYNSCNYIQLDGAWQNLHPKEASWESICVHSRKSQKPLQAIATCTQLFNKIWVSMVHKGKRDPNCIYLGLNVRVFYLLRYHFVLAATVGSALPLHHFGGCVSHQCQHIYPLGDPVKALGDPVFNS